MRAHGCAEENQERKKAWIERLMGSLADRENDEDSPHGSRDEGPSGD